jgi:iron complex outermembrane receptor protein
MKTFIYQLFLMIALLVVVRRASAQTTASVSGLVFTEAGKPGDYATVSLLRSVDSTVVKGSLADEKGAYLMERINTGNYVIKVTMVGYQTGYSSVLTVRLDAKTVKVPPITLLPASHQLAGVTISGTRPLIEHKADRTVMNIENSLLSAGNSALEILARVPGVNIDKDDHISLQGKQGVSVMIDGKLTYLSSDQLAELLKSTDGSTVKSIEVIPNPSAKYDASGTAGIINIKLKKNSLGGSNATLTLGTAYGKHFRDNASLAFSHKQDKLSLFGSFAHRDSKQESNLHITRGVDSAGQRTYFDQSNHKLSSTHGNIYRAGADYEITGNQTIGAAVSGYFNPSGSVNDNPTYLGPNPSAYSTFQSTHSVLNSSHNNIAVNLNDRLKLDTAGQELSADLDYSKFTSNADALYTTTFFLNNGATTTPPLVLRNQKPSTINVRTAKVDYSYPFSKTLKLEAGAKYSNVKTDNNLLAQIRSSDGFINDTSRTNHFIYQEQITAGYFNLNKQYAKTSIQVGVRAEYTHSIGDLVTTGANVERRYLDFFPSLSISHAINDKNDLVFSYSRRINRPGYADLNPFVYYLDQYSYAQGNAFLKPEYSQSLQFSYTYNKTINVSLSYERTSDAMTSVLLTDTLKKATFQTSLNLGLAQNYTLNFNAPYSLTKWWSGSVDLNGIYQQYRSADAISGTLNKSKPTFEAQSTQIFVLGKSDKVEVTGMYNAGSISGYYQVKPVYNVDAGFSHSFAQKKANIKLAVSDIFNTLKYHVLSDAQNNLIDTHQKTETRVARLTFTYNFGSGKNAAHKHESGAEDEKRRTQTNN